MLQMSSAKSALPCYGAFAVRDDPCRSVVKGYDESDNGEPAMQLNLPPDLETLINKRLSSGAYTNAEDVLRDALEAQDAEESWTDEERRALSAHIEEGYQQAERGELIDGEQVRREIQGMKEEWREGRLPGR
jgi:antitoxin ParD1/3/4